MESEGSIVRADDSCIRLCIPEQSFFRRASLIYTKTKSCSTVKFNRHPFNQRYAKKKSLRCMKDIQLSTVYKYTHTLYIYYCIVITLCR